MASAQKEKGKLSILVNRAIHDKERIIIRRGKKPVAAVVPIEDVELLEELEDKIELGDALEALEEVRIRGSSQN